MGIATTKTNTMDIIETTGKDCQIATFANLNCWI